MNRTGKPWRRVARGSATIAKTAGIICVFLLVAGFLFSLLIRLPFLGDRLTELLFILGNLLGPVLSLVFMVCIAIALASLVVCAIAKVFARLDEGPGPEDDSARAPGEFENRTGNRWDAAARRSVSIVRIAAISIFPLWVAGMIAVPVSESFGFVAIAAMALCIVSIPVAMVVNVISKEIARRRQSGLNEERA